MKITTQLLRSRASKPLHACEILDLSNLGLDSLDKLQSCTKLKHLNLRGNNVGYVSGLEGCHQLWKLDLSNNMVSNLDGLQRFVAMGTLILSNNNLTWSELAKLRHMHVLDLSLHGNPQLEKDPYYRIHVIDILPNIWLLDGRIVTSAERVQVEQFFEESALTERPVRHKMCKDRFTPTSMKRIEVTGVFGDRTDHLMRRFPVNGSMNVEMDKRRLKYLAYSVQEDLQLESKYNKKLENLVLSNKTLLEDLLQDRASDRIRCNMMLLILVASLEFAMPIQLVKEALLCAKLDKVGNTEVMALFLLSREMRCLVISLLLSAIKVDKDVGEEGGLYDKLYLCLYYSVSELTRLSQGVLLPDNNNTYKPYPFFRDSKALIASEVVQLLCVVPAFFDSLCRDAGVMNLVAIATADPLIIDRIRKMMKHLEKDGCDGKMILESVSQLILTALQQSNQKVFDKTKDKSDQAKYILNTKMAIPRRPQSSVVNSEYHSTGRSSPEKKTARLKSGRHERRPFLPVARLGEKVLLGPQNIGRVISVPEPDLVLIQMDVVPAASGGMIQNTKNPEEHFTYVDMTQLYWDQHGGFWRPRGTVGDRITLQKGAHKDKSMEDSPQKRSHSDLMKQFQTKPVAPTQLVDLVFQDNKDSPVIPEPVSVRYKKQWNLRLSWKNDNSGEDEPGTEHDISKDEAPLAQQIEDIDENESTLPQENNIEHGEELTTGETDMVDSGTAPPEEDGETTQISRSRRSSLESDYEPELENCATQPSRPSTAGPLSRTESPTPIIDVTMTSTSVPPIEIPRMADDAKKLKNEHVEFEDEATIVNKNDGLQPSREQSAKGSRSQSRASAKAPRMASMLTYPRPISAVDTYRMIVSRENKFFSPYQNQRALAWRDNTEPNEQAVSPPPQRPCSPAAKALFGTDKQHIIKVQRGEQWLGDGRDLHWEKQMTRPRTGHTPGWKQGLPQRPRSAAAIRAIRRSKTPTIATPSSIAYESLFGPGGLRTILDVPEPIITDMQPNRPRSVFHARRLGTTPHNSTRGTYTNTFSTPSSLLDFWLAVDQ